MTEGPPALRDAFWQYHYSTNYLTFIGKFMGQVETKLSESFHEELMHRYLRSSNPYNGDMCAPDAPVLLRKAFLCLSKLLRSFRLSPKRCRGLLRCFCEWTIKSWNVVYLMLLLFKIKSFIEVWENAVKECCKIWFTLFSNLITTRFDSITH